VQNLWTGKINAHKSCHRRTKGKHGKIFCPKPSNPQRESAREGGGMKTSGGKHAQKVTSGWGLIFEYVKKKAADSEKEGDFKEGEGKQSAAIESGYWAYKELGRDIRERRKAICEKKNHR